MGLITDSDVERLMQDQSLMGEVVQAIVSDPNTMDDLAGDIADKLENQMEDSVELRRQIVDAVVNNPEFKRKIVEKLAEDIG